MLPPSAEGTCTFAALRCRETFYEFYLNFGAVEVVVNWMVNSFMLMDAPIDSRTLPVDACS
jgi:hypothetical protein